MTYYMHNLLKSVRVFRVAPPFDKYLIFYDLDAAGVRILRVLHGAQDLESIFTASEP